MTEMSGRNQTEERETVISVHSHNRWVRREQELSQWFQRRKPRRRNKQTVWLGNIHIDAELLTVLTLLKQIEIETEFSCAGVSLLDEPEDHSLYAYITFPASERTKQFVELAMKRMKHRLLVAYEPSRSRYDLSSFFIEHNRSFCLGMESCVRAFMEWESGSNECGTSEKLG